MNNTKLIKHTDSVCPKCFKKIKADIIEREEKIYMLKECPIHGQFEILIMKDKDFYYRIREINISNMCRPNNRFHQRMSLNLILTLRCDLDCPICFKNANRNIVQKEPSLDIVKGVLQDIRNFNIELFGGEPTLREDLSEIIKIIIQSGNKPILDTNGIKISNYNYLKKLKKAGLEEVFLQFDGLCDDIYRKERGKELLNIKLTALKNAQKLSLRVMICATIIKGINEHEMDKLLNFALQNPTVESIYFNGARLLGRMSTDVEKEISAEELIENIEEQTEGKLSKQGILDFQEAFHILLDILSFPSLCVNNCVYLIFRTRKGYKTIGEIINFKKMKGHFERYRKFREKGKFKATLILLLNILPGLLTIRRLSFLFTFFLPFAIKLIYKKRRTFTNLLSRKALVVNFTSMCQPYTFDYGEISNCGWGDIDFLDGKIIPVGIANILLESKRCNIPIEK